MLAAWQAAVHELAALDNVECLQLGGVMGHFAASGIVNQTAVDRYVTAAVAEMGYGRLCFEGVTRHLSYPRLSSHLKIVMVCFEH